MDRDYRGGAVLCAIRRRYDAAVEPSPRVFEQMTREVRGRRPRRRGAQSTRERSEFITIRFRRLIEAAHEASLEVGH